jgi:hypothetical protein
LNDEWVLDHGADGKKKSQLPSPHALLAVGHRFYIAGPEQFALFIRSLQVYKMAGHALNHILN